MAVKIEIWRANSDYFIPKAVSHILNNEELNAVADAYAALKSPYLEIATAPVVGYDITSMSDGTLLIKNIEPR